MLAEIGRRSTPCSSSISRTSIALERLLGRAQDEGRDDDTPEVIARRLAIYHEQTEPVVELLPRHRQARAAPRRAPDRRGRGGDRGGARPARNGAHGVIIRKGAGGDRADRARRGRSSPRRSRTSASAIEPGITTLELDGIADAFIGAQRRHPDLQGLQGLPARDLHLGERRRRPRHPRRAGRRGRRPRHDRRRRHARRRDRRQRVHVRRRRDRPGVAAPARRLPGRARGRDRGGAAREPDRRHLARRADGRRGCRLLGREEPRRPRRRPALPRGSARAELRRARPRAEALGGDDDRDRADDHGGRPRRLAGGRRLDDRHERRLARGAFRAHRRDPARTGRGS